MFGIGQKKSFLGIDIGSTSIKLVELCKERGIPTLLTYGYAEISFDNSQSNDLSDSQQDVVKLLKKLYEKSRAKSFEAVTALPNFSVFNSVITLPILKKKELAEAIHWEAKKFIPMPIEKVVLDWEIIGKTVTGNKKNYKILLTAASKELVKKYVEIFRQANLKLLSMETEAFALTRSLLGKDPSPTMIVDFSARTTDIVIIENGIPTLNRSINIGGITITNAIVNSLGIDFKRADQFKKDIGMAGSSKIPQIIVGIIKPMIDEINYSLSLYQGQSGHSVEKIILSGGSSYLPNLPNYLSESLKMKVFIGDPWARVSYPEDLRPALKEIAPRFSVAIGLALREISS